MTEAPAFAAASEPDFSAGSAPAAQEPKLFIANLNFQTSDEDLMQIFSEFGTVVEVGCWVKEKENRGRDGSHTLAGGGLQPHTPTHPRAQHMLPHPHFIVSSQPNLANNLYRTTES
jgi:hypothetical protein